MPMIPEGRYNAIAETWDLGVTDNGKEYIGIQFRFLEGPVGERRTWYGYFTEKTTKRTIEALRVCGWKGNDFMNLDGLNQNMVQVVVTHEEYEGKTRDRIAFVNNPSSLMVKNPMNDDFRSRFAAQMKGMAMSVPEVEGTPPPANAFPDTTFDDPDNCDPFPENDYSYEPPPHGDDEYPF